MAPSVLSVSPSVLMVTLPPSTTAPGNVMALSSVVMSPVSVVVPLGVRLKVPVSEIAPRLTSPPVIVRLLRFVVPPTAPVSVTAPVSASSVRA